MIQPLLDSFSLLSAWDVAADLGKDAAKYLVGAAAGWALKIARDRWRTRRARTFWRPFLGEDVRIVVGRFEFREFERSGLLGAGDAIASAELQRYLGKIGARVRDTVFADKLEGDVLNFNLICLGGPDANSVTRQLVNRIPSKIRFGDPKIHEVAITDTSRTPPVSYVPSDSGCDDSSIDYGAVVRAPNPFAPARAVLVIAGAFGHGTWAGTRFLTSKEFLDLQHKGHLLDRMECLVEADIVHDTPQTPRVIISPRDYGAPIPAPAI